MSTLTITTGTRTHEFPLTAANGWDPAWAGTDDSLDIGLEAINRGDYWECEVRVGLASIVRGQKAKATMDAEVSFKPPRGYTITWDCERPWPSRWFPMREAIRRFVIHPSDPENWAGIAGGGMELLRWAKARNAFGACNMKLPKIPPKTARILHSQFDFYLGSLRNGLQHGIQVHLEDSEDGPILIGLQGWRPHGPWYRDGPAGSGIYHDTGYQADGLCVPVFWLQACAAHERAWHAYDRATGRPITSEDYPEGTIKYQAGTGDPNNGWLPEFVGVAPWPDPLPLPYDTAHSVRGFRHAAALCEMTDSPMARHMIASQAAQMRLQCGDKGAPPSSGYFPPNLHNLISVAKANPKRGGGLIAGRVMGWPFYLWALDIKFNGTAGSRLAAQAALDWTNLIAPRHGIAQRVTHNPPPPGSGDIWYDAAFDLAHSFEVPIFWYGAVGCAVQLEQAIPDAFERAARSVLESVKKGPYYSGDLGPMDYLYVAKRGGEPIYPLADGKPGSSQVIGDPTLQENMCALAFDTTDDPRFLQDALGIGTTAPDLHAKRINLESRTNLYSHAFLLAHLQETA